MRLRYAYHTHVCFCPSIGRHTIQLRCLPAEVPFQRTECEEFHINEGFWLREGCDGQGNRLILAGTDERHTELQYTACGEVDCTTYCIPDESPHPMYRQPSPLTQPNDGILQLLPHDRLQPDRSSNGQKNGEQGSECLRECMEIAHSVHRHMHYTPSITTPHTTAAEAFRLRQGVCQDFAHLMVTLCRAAGYPARYVCGLMKGEGATHAWVEVHDGQCWYAFDPTNDTAVASGYIKMAHGRDAQDCPVSRGTFVGIAEQTTEVNVRVEEL